MIQNIIFDFGGVIYDIDHNLSKLAFEKLGVDRFDQLYGHEIQTEIFEDLETGKINPADFLEKLKIYLSENTTIQQIEDAWCALLIGVEAEKIKLLQKLGENYNLYLLSNSNLIHYKRFIKQLEEHGDFRGLFKGVWFSHEKGMRKPDARFYLDLLEENNLKAEETLFIDDLDANIEAAQKLGIKAYYLKEESILDLFKNGKFIGKL